MDSGIDPKRKFTLGGEVDNRQSVQFMPFTNFKDETRYLLSVQSGYGEEQVLVRATELIAIGSYMVRLGSKLRGIEVNKSCDSEVYDAIR